MEQFFYNHFYLTMIIISAICIVAGFLFIMSISFLLIYFFDIIDKKNNNKVIKK